MSPISVIVPTFRRPESLERALRSLLTQDRFAELVHEVLVVDNDAAASAHTTVARLQTGEPRLRYLPCPEPGVSTARNAGVASTHAPLVAFLDDDEEAPPHWLATLHDAHVALGVDVTFGPVRGRADQAPAWKRAYLENFFSRFGPAATVAIDEVYGCGNSLLTRATTLAGDEPFDVGANETGGEDDRLFLALKAGGRRFGWAADAGVYEHAAANRQTLRYALVRAFGYGQSPCQIAARKGCHVTIARWMAIGAAQAALYGVAAALAMPFRTTTGLMFTDKAVRGLGKMVWFVVLKYYGAPAAKPAPSSSRFGRVSRMPVAAKITQ